MLLDVLAHGGGEEGVIPIIVSALVIMTLVPGVALAAFFILGDSGRGAGGGSAAAPRTADEKTDP